MLPNHRLLARTFHRIRNPNYISSPISPARRLSVSSINRKWEGRKAEEHIAREEDSHNVHIDAAKDGKSERASGQGSIATSEKGKDANEKAEKDNKEAPKPVIGMNDERGGVSACCSGRFGCDGRRFADPRVERPLV